MQDFPDSLEQIDAQLFSVPAHGPGLALTADRAKRGEGSGPSDRPAPYRLDLLLQRRRVLTPSLVPAHRTGFVHLRQHPQRGLERLPIARICAKSGPTAETRSGMRTHLHRDLLGLAEVLENGQEALLRLMLVTVKKQ